MKTPYATAYTLDGSIIFTAENAQQLSDGVARHVRENRRPHLAYTEIPGHAYPFTVWVSDDHAHIVGTSYLTLSGVFDHWDRVTGRA